MPFTDFPPMVTFAKLRYNVYSITRILTLKTPILFRAPQLDPSSCDHSGSKDERGESKDGGEMLLKVSLLVQRKVGQLSVLNF